MNFLIAVVIGAAVGVIGWFLIRQRRADAIWLAPLSGIVGALLASVLATMFGQPGYGIKEAGLQVVLAVLAVGSLVAMARRGSTTASAK
jgi:uncharacterized membrane protein YeaQ/YmgE (transglycosylase-associated protein family)